MELVPISITTKYSEKIASLSWAANELTIGSYALTVGEKDTKAAEFYTYQGFIELQNEPLMLFFPLAKVPQKVVIK